MTQKLPRDVALLAGLFALSGTVHLVRPEVFRPLVPEFVPAGDQVVTGSGVAELACAVGLLLPATRSRAGAASAALLLAVWPGNVTMALDSLRSRSTLYKGVAFGRLPLQVPMIRTALKAARHR